jgi:S-DNA-T family DNA segregation ATPase FtsK/SpoIIIE
VKEMEDRYKLLEAARKRDIVSYNSSGEEFMPYLVIVIDELADLMASFGKEVESSIVRIAQMARAVGIHLVVSTQRPSVEVITGLIKANITSRIAFQVASQIDSRTILDGAGADKLLGNGDMLYLAGDAGRPRRIQGAFVSELEVKHVTDFIREQDTEAEYNEEILKTKSGVASGIISGDEDSIDDELYEVAYEAVLTAGKASATYLQRRLKVGYSRAARLLDMLEDRGVIGPGDGAKPREILIQKSDDGESHVA